MENKTFIGIATAIAAIFIILFYFKGKRPSVIIPPNSNGFSAPYTSWPNGIYPGTSNMNGSETPFTPIQVTVNVPQYGNLSQDYMPLFGFMGVTAVG